MLVPAACLLTVAAVGLCCCMCHTTTVLAHLQARIDEGVRAHKVAIDEARVAAGLEAKFADDTAAPTEDDSAATAGAGAGAGADGDEGIVPINSEVEGNKQSFDMDKIEVMVAGDGACVAIIIC